MMPFIRRHIVPVLLALFGLIALATLNAIAESHQVGVNPYEFALKAAGKIFYLGLAWICTHIIVKYYFTTIYDWCGKGDKEMSEFSRAWKSENYDPRLPVAVYTHIGIFLSLCLLFALAF